MHVVRQNVVNKSVAKCLYNMLSYGIVYRMFRVYSRVNIMFTMITKPVLNIALMLT